MDLIQAETLAKSLMFRHDIQNWTFAWNNRKTSYGVCSYRRKTIFLSKILTSQIDVDAVTNTILHEIAHALVGSVHKHDSVWQRKAIEIGSDGQRCNDHNVTVQAKYLADCNNCGKTHKKHRRPKRNRWCICTNHSFDPNMKLIFIQQY